MPEYTLFQKRESINSHVLSESEIIDFDASLDDKVIGESLFINICNLCLLKMLFKRRRRIIFSICDLLYNDY